MSYGANGWVYTIALHPKTPVNAPHYGERRSMTNGAVIYFEECEFTDLCTALSLAETYHVNQLNAIRAKINTHCNIGTSG